MAPIMIVSTYPNKISASKVAREVVSARLAACVNIIKISSVYMWNNKMESGPEYLALFKTVRKNRKKLKENIASSHPYDVPEIAEIDISSINTPYLKWILDSTI